MRYHCREWRAPRTELKHVVFARSCAFSQRPGTVPSSLVRLERLFDVDLTDNELSGEYHTLKSRPTFLQS